MSDPRDHPDDTHPGSTHPGSTHLGGTHLGGTHPDPASLAGFADPALRDLTRRLEAKVTRGDATLADYGALARCHAEWVRRAPARAAGRSS